MTLGEMFAAAVVEGNATRGEQLRRAVYRRWDRIRRGQIRREALQLGYVDLGGEA